jgi:hypothetical protein
LSEFSGIVRQLLKTLALVAMGGGLLYLVVSFIASEGVEHGAQYWVTLVLLVPISLLMAKHLAEALRDGEMPVRLATIRRDRQPISYWFAIVWTAVVLVALVGLSIYALVSLL